MSSQSINKTWSSTQIKETSTPKKKKAHFRVVTRVVPRMFKTSTLRDMHSAVSQTFRFFKSSDTEPSRIDSERTCGVCSQKSKAKDSHHRMISESTRIKRPRPWPICCSSFTTSQFTSDMQYCPTPSYQPIQNVNKKRKADVEMSFQRLAKKNARRCLIKDKICLPTSQTYDYQDLPVFKVYYL